MGISNADSGYNTLLKRGDGGTQSQYITDSGDSGILWQARTPGVAGDLITIEVKLDGVQVTTSVAAVGNAVTVTLRSADGIAVLATAQEVIDAVRGEDDADALLVLTNIGNGSGVVTEETPAVNLAGGVDEIFTTVAEVTDISGPSLDLNMIEVSHMESPDANREFVPGLKDPGSVSIDLNFLPANLNQQGFLNDYVNRTKRNFQIVWPNTEATTWQFSGYVINFEPSTSVDDKLSASAEIKVTGSPNFDAS